MSSITTQDIKREFVKSKLGITGILIITNQLQVLGYYILNYLPFLEKFG